MSTPTMVRNTHGGPAVFSHKGEHVEWAGAGDPMRGDLQPVPPEFLENVQFHRMVARGVFQIVEVEDEVDAALAAHRLEYEQRSTRQQSASAASIDMAPDNDSLMKDCLGPSATGFGKCDQKVAIKVREQRDKPPLCSMHTELAPRFVAMEGTKVIGGKAEIIWQPIQLGAREQQQN